MPVQIQINGGDAAEAVKELSALASHFGGGQAPVAAAATESTKQRSRGTSKIEPTGSEPTNPRAEKTAQPEQSSSGSADVASGNVPTVIEIRAKATEIGATAEGKKTVKALLDEFGSKSISDIPEDQRSAFMARLEELA